MRIEVLIISFFLNTTYDLPSQNSLNEFKNRLLTSIKNGNKDL